MTEQITKLSSPAGVTAIYSWDILPPIMPLSPSTTTKFLKKNVSMSRDLPSVGFVDIALVKEGDKCPHCKETLTITRGIEIGNIFQLGTKYTKTMGMKINMPDGTSKEPIMGCYGIGIGRAILTFLRW